MNQNDFLIAKALVISALESMGGAGYIETKTASFVTPSQSDFVPDVEIVGVGFKWFSPEIPTKDELMAGQVISVNETTEKYPTASVFEVYTEVGNSFVISGGVLVLVAAELNNEMETVPKTGMYYALTPNTYSAMKVTFEWKTLHPIDPKFLPGVCLPVVELTTAPTTEGAQLTDAEAAAVDALNGSPCILKIAFTEPTGMTVKTYASCIEINGITLQYETPPISPKDGAQVLLANEGGWLAILQ